METKRTTEQEMSAPKKRLTISISFKMISIISLIVITSFTIMTFISSRMFVDDTKIRSEENTLEKAELVALKASSDFRAIVEKSKLAIIAVKDSTNAKKAETFSLESEKSDSDIFSSMLFQKDPDMIYISLVGRNKDSFTEKKSLQNIDFFLSNGIQSSIAGKILSSEKDALKRAFSGDDCVVNLSPYFHKPVTGIFSPYDRKSSDVLCIIVSSNIFAETVRSPNIVKSFIVNGSGDLIAHYDSDLVERKTNFINLPIVAKMIASSGDNEKIPYVDADGKRYMGSFKKIGFSDIGAIATVSEDIAFSAAYQIRYRTILIALIVLNIAILSIYFFSKTLTRPIKELVKVSREIEGGNFNISVTAKSRDEIGLLTESFSDMAKGLAEREKMKDAFGKFVNKEIAEMVLKNELALGGERKTAVIFFSDIRSFTAISEKLEPEEVVEFLNQYMTLMVNIINETSGVVDKFIGDAIMAVWGTPISKGNDTENAVNAALLMREALREFNKGRGSDKKPIISIGCGINTGPVLAGQIGSQERMEYTVIGDTVNLASRIESLNKPFGTDILISTDAYNQVKDIFITEPMDKIKVKGKTAPQQIYAVINRIDAKKGPKTISEVRAIIGVDEKNIKKSAQNYKDEKYEII